MEYFAGQMTVSEQIRVLKRHLDLTARLQRETHFNSTEIEYLILIYYQVLRDGNGSFMTDKQLEQIMEDAMDMTDEDMINRIFTVLKKRATTEIPIDRWIQILSLFLRGNLKEQMEYCFSIYDRQGIGKITKEIAFIFLRKAIFSNESSRTYDEDSVRDLVEVLMAKVDADRDGKISFDDYKGAVLKDPSFMQFLGPCLPQRQSVQKFLNTFTIDAKILFC